MTPRDEPGGEDDFGFYYDVEDVQLAWVGLKVFSKLPYSGGWFDQPYNLLMDILTYDRLVRRSDPDAVFYPADVYEEQMNELEKRIQF